MGTTLDNTKFRDGETYHLRGQFQIEMITPNWVLVSTDTGEIALPLSTEFFSLDHKYLHPRWMKDLHAMSGLWMYKGEVGKLNMKYWDSIGMVHLETAEKTIPIGCPSITPRVLQQVEDKYRRVAFDGEEIQFKLIKCFVKRTASDYIVWLTTLQNVTKRIAYLNQSVIVYGLVEVGGLQFVINLKILQ